MKRSALLFWALGSLGQAALPSPGRGIPEILATERATSIRGLRYELLFRVPEAKNEALHGSETVRFELSAPRQVVLDFEQKRDRILSVRADGKMVPFDFVDGHIVVPA